MISEKMSQEEPIWTISSVLRATQQVLQSRQCRTPRLDAEVLLAEVLHVERIALYTHFDRPLTLDERACYREFVRRRLADEPVAYIIGKKEFYGRSFRVDPAVLIPRPETEHLIDTVVDYCRERRLNAPRILDVCTGSGCVGLSLAAELAGSWVMATDISPEALVVAKENARTLGVTDQTEWICGDLLEPLSAQKISPVDVMVANPPYVALAERATLPPDVRKHEPELALFSAGAHGLEVIERLVQQAPEVLRVSGLLALEIGATQRDEVVAMFEQGAAGAKWENIACHRDLQGHWRVVEARLACTATTC